MKRQRQTDMKTDRHRLIAREDGEHRDEQTESQMGKIGYFPSLN